VVRYYGEYLRKKICLATLGVRENVLDSYSIYFSSAITGFQWIITMFLPVNFSLKKIFLITTEFACCDRINKNNMSYIPSHTIHN